MSWVDKNNRTCAIGPGLIFNNNLKLFSISTIVSKAGNNLKIILQVKVNNLCIFIVRRIEMNRSSLAIKELMLFSVYNLTYVSFVRQLLSYCLIAYA